MAKLFEVVEGWTQELGPITLKMDGVALDLTGLTVVLALRGNDDQVITIAGSTRVASNQVTEKGHVYYTPAAADLTRAKSPINIRWKVTDGAGTIVFFPNAAADQIVVYEP